MVPLYIGSALELLPKHDEQPVTFQQIYVSHAATPPVTSIVERLLGALLIHVKHVLSMIVLYSMLLLLIID